MNVLIVGRTKMGSSPYRCIGGISQDNRSLRLLKSAGEHWGPSVGFQVGQIWDVTYTLMKPSVHPHTEDAVVSQYQFVSTQSNLREHLLTRVTPWYGGIDQVFGGVLGYTSNNNGYVCTRLGVPSHSTWFWIPDRDLKLRTDGKHYDYYPDPYLPRGLSYVGEPSAPPSLPAGTLIRVSLARWWKPDDVGPDLEKRCYLQLSGWYA